MAISPLPANWSNWSHSTAWKIAASRFSTSAVTRLSLRKLTFANRRNLLPYSAQVSAEKTLGGEMRHRCGNWRGACLACVAAIGLVAPASAQTPVEIVEGWIEQAESFDWLDISHDGVSHDAASGTTTVEQLELAIEFFDLPGDVSDEEPDSVDMRYGLTFPSLVFDGLEADGDYYVADRIRADELLIDFQIESENQGTSSTTGSYDGLAAFALRWARLPDIEEDPARPDLALLSSWWQRWWTSVSRQWNLGRSTSCPRPPSRP